MYIDFVGLMNTLTWLVASIVSIMVAYRGVEFGRAFIGGVFRSRALWITALGVVTFIQAVPGYILPISDFTIGGLAFFEIAWSMLFLTYLAFVDSTIMVTLQLDFFHRDTLRWKQGRFVVYVVLGILVADILLVGLGIVSNPSTSAVVIIPLLVSSLVVAPYSGVALLVGARRTRDRILKRHLILLVIVFVLYISHFVEASPNNPTLASSLLEDFLVLAGVYALYRAVMTLSVVGKLETDPVAVPSKKKKQARRVITIAAIVLVALLALLVYTQASSSPATGPWTASTSYPLQAGGNYGVVGQSCVSDAAYVYCVGGTDPSFNTSSRAFSSAFSGAVVGTWTSATNQYPKSVTTQSCVASSGFLYCVGGTYDSAADDTALSYFTPITSGTIGAWSPTTSFPAPVDSQACVASVGYIYCVGGTIETAGTNATSDLSNSAWYASLSSAGIGTWMRTSSYPQGAFLPTCAASNGYVYCVGGVARGPGVHGGVNYYALSNTQNNVYFAPLSSSGIGNWTQTTNYPIQVAALSCVASSVYLYCVGGEQSGGTTVNGVYSARVTSSGAGPWYRAGDYPAGIVTTCVASGGYISCLGGYESDTCLAAIVNFYCLDGNEGTFAISSTTYYVPLSVLTTTSG
jgi:N-acetylneuraminic acid mutarotase